MFCQYTLRNRKLRFIMALFGLLQTLKVYQLKLFNVNHYIQMAWVENLENAKVFLLLRTVSLPLLGSCCFMVLFTRNQCFGQTFCSVYPRTSFLDFCCPFKYKPNSDSTCFFKNPNLQIGRLAVIHYVKFVHQRAYQTSLWHKPPVLKWKAQWSFSGAGLLEAAGHLSQTQNKRWLSGCY